MKKAVAVEEEQCVDGKAIVNIHIGESDEQVILSFDKSIAWIEMTPLVAIRVAETIKEKAISILRSEPIT